MLAAEVLEVSFLRRRGDLQVGRLSQNRKQKLQHR